MDKQPLVKKPELTPKPPTFDAGFKCWGVCLTSFLTTFVVIGISDVFGVMLEEFKEHYEVSTSKVLFAGATLGAFTLLPSPLAGIAVTKIGHKLTGWIGALLSILGLLACYRTKNFAAFELCYGFVLGLALSFLYLPAKTSIELFFKQWPSLATGITLSGGALAYILMPKVSLSLHHVYGLNGMFIGNALLVAALAPLIQTFYPSKDEAQERRDLLKLEESVDPAPEEPNWKVAKTPLFWMFFVTVAFLSGGHIVTLVFIPKLESKQLDLSMEDSTIFLSVLGLTNFIGRLVVGWICQKKMACPLILHCLGHLGSSVCLILYHFITNYWLMAAAVAIQGVAQAFYVCTIPFSALRLFGVARVNFVMGVLVLATGVGAFTVSPIVSHFYEQSVDKLFGGLTVLSLTHCIAGALTLPMWVIYNYQGGHSSQLISN